MSEPNHECKRAGVPARAFHVTYQLSADVLYQQKPPLLPQPPQQKRSKMIQMQLSLPKPQPPQPELLCPHPPQQESRRMIQMMLLHPLFCVVSQPHPQFVAAKSLMFESSGIFCLHSMICRAACLFCLSGEKIEMILEL